MDGDVDADGGSSGSSGHLRGPASATPSSSAALAALSAMAAEGSRTMRSRLKMLSAGAAAPVLNVPRTSPVRPASVTGASDMVACQPMEVASPAGDSRSNAVVAEMTAVETTPANPVAQEPTLKRARTASDTEDSRNGVEPSRGVCDTIGDDGFVTVVNKKSFRRVIKAEAELSRFRESVDNGSGPVYTVRFTSQDSTLPAPEGSNKQQQVRRPDFSGEQLVKVFKALHDLVPTATLGGGPKGITATVPTISAASDLVSVSALGGVPVIGLCSTMDQFWGVIKDINPAFSDECLLSELASYGAMKIRRDTRPGLKNEKSVRVPSTRIHVLFKRTPPNKVFIVWRDHDVSVEASSPIVCFNCQRTGHTATRCTRARACRRCGAHDHLAASCRNRARCVDCSGPHPRGDSGCPVFALAREKSKVLLGSRMLQHAQLSTPAATLVVVPDPAPTRPGTSAPSTYAAAVRRLVIPASPDEAPEPSASRAEVVLPPLRPIPAPRKSTLRAKTPPPPETGPSKQVKAAFRRPSKRHRRLARSEPVPRGRAVTRVRARPPKSTDDFDFGSLSKAVSMLARINPKLGDTLRGIVKALRPLLALAPLLQGLVSPAPAPK